MDQQYQQDLEHIRRMMERSTRFLSLSGLSGIFAGLVAMAGAVVVYMMFRSEGVDYFDNVPRVYSASFVGRLMMAAVIILVVALSGAYFFTARKSKGQGIPLWDTAAKRLVLYFSLPLAVGAVVCLALHYHHLYGFIAPVMLIFYGFSLVMASKYTFDDLQYLGLAEIALGLVSIFFLGWGLVFWAIGFGILHIIYGIVMYRKYD